MKCVDSR